METLLQLLAEEIFALSNHWLEGVGDPVALMNETFEGLTRTCHRHGPFLRALSDAATTDERFEKDWVLQERTLPLPVTASDAIHLPYPTRLPHS